MLTTFNRLSESDKRLVDSEVLLSFFRQEGIARAMNALATTMLTAADVPAARAFYAEYITNRLTPPSNGARNQVVQEAMDLLANIDEGRVTLDPEVVAALTHVPRRSSWVKELVTQTTTRQVSPQLSK